MKLFEEYVKTKIINKISPDKSRSKFLIEESKISLRGLKERMDALGINENNANSIIKDCYDILMELIRAKLLIDGYISSGLYAHEAEISYMKVLGFKEDETAFMNELRFFRNRVTYYGKILNKEYATKVFAFLNKIYPLLINNLDRAD